MDEVGGPLDGDGMRVRRIFAYIYIYLILLGFTSFRRLHNLFHTWESMLTSHPSRRIGYAV